MHMKQLAIHILIIVVSAALRFIFLDKFPIGISGDELDYVLNAKALAVTGTDLSQTWNPLLLQTPPFEVPKAELPYFLIAPFIGISPLSLFFARLPFALFSVLFTVVMYLLSAKLFDRNKALIIGLIAAINPWCIYFGRTSFDTPLAVYFYFFGLYLLLVLKKKKVFLALIAFTIAFFSYIGTKLIYLPFVSISIFYAWYENNKKDTFMYAGLFVVALISLLFFVVRLPFSPVSYRQTDILSYKSADVVSVVNSNRRLSIQTPLTNILDSKPIILGKKLVENYLSVFSTSYLFLYGENSPFISLWTHGVFYYIDSIFMLLGVCYAFCKNRKIFFLLVSIVLIAPIPSLASVVGSSYSIRSSAMFPVLIIFIGLGISYVIYFFKTPRYKLFVAIAIAGIYFFSLINFLNIYLFRNPVYSSETFGFSGRLVSRYVVLSQQQNQDVYFMEAKPSVIPYILKQYIFYANIYNKQSSKTIAKVIQSRVYQLNNLHIGSCPKALATNTAVITSTNGCSVLSKYTHKLTIPLLGDGGAVYTIYNDNLCSMYQLKRYPSDFRINDFAIESLSAENFCKLFITDLK